MFVTIQPMHRLVVLALTRSSRSTSRSRRRCSATTADAVHVLGLRGGGRPGAHERRVRRRRAGRSRGARAGRHGARARLHATPRVPDEPVLDALRSAHERGARMVSICTGAFALAAAGVLDGRRATTHWRDAAELAARHPRVDVEPGVLYIDEGQVLTAPASPRAWTSACTSSAATTAPRWPTRSRGGSSSRRTARAARRSTSSSRCPKRRRVARGDPRLGARAPARAAHGPHARHPRARLRAHVRPPLPRRDRRPGPALAARPARRRRPHRAGVHRRLDRRDRPPLRLRHRREPAQALPPRIRTTPTAYRRAFTDPRMRAAAAGG